MAATKPNNDYEQPSSLPSSNPPTPPGPFPARPEQWESAPTAEPHIVAPHGAFDAMNAAPEPTAADGAPFKPLSAS